MKEYLRPALPKRATSGIPLNRYKIEKFSGFRAGLGKIEVLKKHNYYVTDQPVSGDAPKKFIKLYEFGSGAKRNSKKWPAFTEYLLNRLGEALNIRMAESKLAYGGSQIRFLSKYF